MNNSEGKDSEKEIKINDNSEENNKDKNNIENGKELDNFDDIKKQLNKIDNSDVKENKNDDENNLYYKALENPFDEDCDDLLENVDFPEDEQFDNKFSNLRSSQIPDYFKNLRSKTIIENKNNFTENRNQNNIEAQDEGNTNEIIDEEENTIKDEKEGNNKNDKDNEVTTTSTYKNYKNDPVLFNNKWKDKILTLNKWIKEGKESNNFFELSQGIKQILIGLDEIEEIITNCAKIGDETGRNEVSCIKADIEQTCYRYECLILGRKVEKFKSAFDGNVKKYYFYKETILEDPKINNSNNNDVDYQKGEKKRTKFMNFIKNGFRRKSKSKEIKNK